MKKVEELKHHFKHWQVIADMVDQCIDLALNLSQSGHPGGSRSKVYPLLSTLLSGAMRFDIRNPDKRFADRFVLVAGHTNPLVYSTLAVFNEALRRKYKKTGDAKYLNPKGDKFTLNYEDLLTLRRKGGLPGHAEMEGKTLFFKFNTGPSGHGSPAAVGEAMALKYAGYSDVKVFAFEGEGGLSTGVSHESKNSAFGLGTGNLIYVIDWNDFGIDSRPFSDIVAGTPEDWFKPYGFKVDGTLNGESFEDISASLYRLIEENNDENQPKMMYVKSRKGRGYGKFDFSSHGMPHKRNSKEFWDTKREFQDKYKLEFPYLDAPDFNDEVANTKMTKECLEVVMSLFDREAGLLDYLADYLVELGESVPAEERGVAVFDNNPVNDPDIFDYNKYPEKLFLKAGEKAPNRQGLANFGSWINSYCQKKYGRPLFLVSSADLAESTSIFGFSKGFDGMEDFGMYHRVKNPKGTLFPQGITEFANAGIMAGIATINLSKDPYNEFNGFYGASSTYAAFSYLKYGALRLFSQMAQDSEIKLGKILYVAGHSGPETAEDSRTHFGIFEPGVTKLFPDGHVLNLHPSEYNEVPVMMAEALKSSVSVLVLHLTRPAIEIPDREKLGLGSYLDAAKGAYILKDYDHSRPKEGIILIRGTAVFSELMKIMPKLQAEGPNVKIIASLSFELFKMQSKEYQDSVIAPTEYFDSMIMTTSGIRMMEDWMSHPLIKEYSLSSDQDNRWRAGGNLAEVIEDAHLSADYQWEAIVRFAKDRGKRLTILKEMIA